MFLVEYCYSRYQKLSTLWDKYVVFIMHRILVFFFDIMYEMLMFVILSLEIVIQILIDATCSNELQSYDLVYRNDVEFINGYQILD